MTFLPGKFYAKKDFKPKPMPAVQGGQQVASDSTIPNKTFSATVEIKGVPKRRDPTKLEYDEALNHFPAIIVDGPFAGQEIGMRSWSMYGGDLRDPAFDIKVGSKLKVTLMPWQEATQKTEGLANHMVFNDSDQDLLIPVFWVSKGKLSAKSLKVPQK